MEGGRTALAVVLAVWAAGFLVVGCDSSGGGGALVRTDRPAVTFAPFVQLHPKERWLPMGARWFIDRSALWFAEDDGCDHRKIAVGRRLEAQHTEIVDWLFVTGLGLGTPSYTRIAYDERCELYPHAEFSTVQTTRPWERHRRPAELRLGEGFFLDLMDWARPGPGVEALPRVPIYVERHRRDVDGDPGLQLTYWILFGMNDRRSSRPAGVQAAREGDWERLDVLLRGSDGAYEPVSLRLHEKRGRVREVPWRSARLAAARGSDGPTHPVMAAERGTHSLDPRPRRCPHCIGWATWRRVESARGQHWYGFGGAWGDYGPSRRTTGPLGPRGGEPAPPVDPPDGLEGAGDPIATTRPAVAFAPLVLLESRERARGPVRRPVYYARQRTTVERRAAVRLVYWVPLRARGDRTLRGRGRDWLRVDVLTVEGRHEGHWLPVALDVRGDGRSRVSWSEVAATAAGDGTQTHPTLLGAVGSDPSRPDGERASDCPTCMRWRTWRHLRPLTFASRSIPPTRSRRSERAR